MDRINVYIPFSLLDDDPDMHDEVKELLKEYNLNNYIIDSDPRSFIDKLDNGINVIAVDHSLSHGMTGLDVVKEARKKNHKSWVMVVSGLHISEVIIEYVNVGIEAWIDKNWPYDTYRQKFAEALRRGFQEAANRVVEDKAKEMFKDRFNERMNDLDLLIKSLKG